MGGLGGSRGALAVVLVVSLAGTPTPAQEASRFKLTQRPPGEGLSGGSGGGRLRGQAEAFLDILSVALPVRGCSCAEGGAESSRERLPPGMLLGLEPRAGADVALRDDARGERLLARAVLAEEGEAVGLLGRAAAADPRLLARLIVAGHGASQQGRHRDALTLLSLALRLDPSNGDALELSGVSLQNLGEIECARCFHVRSLLLDPARPVARLNLGLLLLHTGRVQEAAVELTQAVELCLTANQVQPALVHAALQGLGSAYSMMGEYHAALPVLHTCLRWERRSRECLLTAAAVLTEIGREEQAIDMLSRALAASQPLRLEEDAVVACLLELSLAHASVGSWRPRERIRSSLENSLRLHVAKGTVPPKAVNVLLFLSLPEDLDLAITRILSRDAAQAAALEGGNVHNQWGAHLSPGQGVAQHGLVVVYLSADFGQTVMLSFMAHALTLHTRGQGVQVVCLSVNGAHHEGSAWRKEVQQGVQRFTEAGLSSDDGVAQLVNALGTAVLIHLDGHNHGSHLGVFVRKPAPVQMAYRFCASVGAEYIPFYAGDVIMAPPETARTFFSEGLLLLPATYLVNSFKHRFSSFPEGGITRVASMRVEMRQQHGLALDAFVFACFNRVLKIDSETFGAWVRILKAVPSSVIWLVRFPAAAEKHLIKASEASGLGHGRVVFSPMAKEEVFLAMALASDAFLDTPPCNAHTTATYSLWSGTPVLSLPGTRPVARVAASLLVAAKVAHVFTFRSLEEYSDAAIAIARRGHRNLLAVGMDKESRIEARSGVRLFDANAWVASMERGIRTLWEVYQGGAMPSPGTRAAAPHVVISSV